MGEWETMVVVGRIARPHGLSGLVVVHPETDFVEERFRPHAALWTRLDGRERVLRIASVRMNGGRPLVAFEGFTRIEDVEPLAGLELRVPEAELRPLEPGRYYEHSLVGCVVETVGRMPVGVVIRVEGGQGVSRLVVDGTRGEVLIPFAREICVEIDVEARRILVDPPEGLLEVNEVGGRR
jgi:16S rRNA processing protein RimM